MHNLHHELDTLEDACENKKTLASYNLPDLNRIAETILLLPRGEQEGYFNRLQRISMILEGQMLALSEELEDLRKKIPAAQVNSAAAKAYARRIAAVIPIKPANDSK